LSQGEAEVAADILDHCYHTYRQVTQLLQEQQDVDDATLASVVYKFQACIHEVLSYLVLYLIENCLTMLSASLQAVLRQMLLEDRGSQLNTGQRADEHGHCLLELVK
jgi:hypothetical protein